MYWEPRVMRHIETGVEWFAVHEVYFTDDGSPEGWTEDALSPRAPTPEALGDAIRQLLAAGQEAVVTGDLAYEYETAYVEEWLTCLDQPILDYGQE